MEFGIYVNCKTELSGDFKKSWQHTSPFSFWYEEITNIQQIKTKTSQNKRKYERLASHYTVYNISIQFIFFLSLKIKINVYNSHIFLLTLLTYRNNSFQLLHLILHNLLTTLFCCWKKLNKGITPVCFILRLFTCKYMTKSK